MSTILVTGDFLVDHHIYEGRRHHFGDQNSPGVCVKKEFGGAALVHRLLVAMKEQSGAAWTSHQAVNEQGTADSPSPCEATDESCFDQPFAAYAFWRPYPAPGKSKDLNWRVAEAMGFGGGATAENRWPWRVANDLPTSPNVLVVSDGGMGFRSRTNLPHWRLPMPELRIRQLFQPTTPEGAVAAALQQPQWIVLKMSAPVGEGDLWRELSQFHADHLVVVVSAAELRRANIRMSKGLSWEQTLEDLHQALRSNGRLQSLAKCRHLVIAFDGEGVIWFNNDGVQRKACFLFDPVHIEGEMRQGTQGDVYGHLSCLTATIAAEFATAPDQPDWVSAMRKGLVAMRQLRECGHGDATKPGAGFPVKLIAQAVAKGDASAILAMREYACDEHCPVKPGWSLLALHESPTPGASGAPLYGIARRVLIQGARALRAPTLKIGDFFTADRSEIEALRSLRQLVRPYLDDRKADKPLSIGVFGPPGAGKSFAVRELAKDLLGDRLGWLEFNLSQFNGPQDLIGALHQVRDKVLEGKTPVAFFDEFDSQNFTWLKYLLAPMQDGRFQEGQISHPVGQCLFVFAGGTSHTFEAFAAKGTAPRSDCVTSESSQQTAAQQRSIEHFILSKGPDFASRLDGKLNVVGPNPRSASSTTETDIFFQIRRALFIRARLRCRDAERLRIHPGLATALLEIPQYKHGSRSLVKLLENFRLLRRVQPDVSLDLSSLPPPDQISLHVDLQEFNALTRRDEEAVNQLGLDNLAGAVHRFYRKKATAEKWIKPQHDCEFPELSPFDQASNRAAARRMPGVLALAGLKLVPGKATAAELDKAREVLCFHADILGEAEHDGWCDWHIDNGWLLATERTDAAQRHTRLVSYSALPAEEQDKDKNAINHYPEIADLAGFKIAASYP